MHNTGSEPAGMPANAGELDWLAFRYIAGELSPAEMLAFESQLEGDLSACEAVARAVQLAEVLAVGANDYFAEMDLSSIAGPQPQAFSSAGKAGRGSRWAAFALAGVAALVAVGVLNMRVEPQVTAPEPSVVGIWADSWHSDFDAESPEVSPELAPVGENHASEQTDTEDLLAPGWLLAAVNGDAGAPNSDEPDMSTERQEN